MEFVIGLMVDEVTALFFLLVIDVRERIFIAIVGISVVHLVVSGRFSTSIPFHDDRFLGLGLELLDQGTETNIDREKEARFEGVDSEERVAGTLRRTKVVDLS